MGLDGAYTVAGSGLANITRELAIVSQNVANANTPDYVREVANQTSATAEGVGMGVRAAATTRDIDAQLQAASFGQDAVVAGLQTQQSALQAIDAVQGTPAVGNDLSSLLGQLQDAFSTLGNDPSSSAQQSKVVDAAAGVARQLNALSGAVGAARQAAQDGIASGVAAVNAGLGTIGSLSSRIVQLRATGQDTADLENQRDAAMHGVASATGARFLEQPNGDMLAETSTGLSLPLHGAATLAAANATAGVSATYPGGLPGVTLQGIDVTAQVTGGTLGAEIKLRDATLPTFQAQLDQFAQTLASRFDAQGLTLFADPAGTVPPVGGSPAQAGYVGFAGTIKVNPAVIANPALVRDGTRAVAGSAAGAAAFAPNPPGGAAGFSGLVTRVLDYALGTEAQNGVAQPDIAVVGLGSNGTLSAGFEPPGSLAQFAATLVAAQSQTSAATTAAVSDQTALQTALRGRLSSRSAVSVDSELSTMIALQQAYSANARVMSTTQAMWQQLIAGIPA